VGDDVPHYVRTSLMYKWSKSQWNVDTFIGKIFREIFSRELRSKSFRSKIAWLVLIVSQSKAKKTCCQWEKIDRYI
jgi:hypothetical protein